MFFDFLTLFSKHKIFRLQHLFLLSTHPVSSFFIKDSYSWRDFFFFATAPVVYKVWILGHFGKWRLDVVQKSLLIFLSASWPQNIVISRYQNVSIHFVNNTYIGNIRTISHIKLYMKSWYSLKCLSDFLGPNYGKTTRDKLC